MGKKAKPKGTKSDPFPLEETWSAELKDGVYVGYVIEERADEESPWEVCDQYIYRKRRSLLTEKSAFRLMRSRVEGAKNTDKWVARREWEIENGARPGVTLIQNKVTAKTTDADIDMMVENIRAARTKHKNPTTPKFKWTPEKDYAALFRVCLRKIEVRSKVLHEETEAK